MTPGPADANTVLCRLLLPPYKIFLYVRITIRLEIKKKKKTRKHTLHRCHVCLTTMTLTVFLSIWYIYVCNTCAYVYIRGKYYNIAVVVVFVVVCVVYRRAGCILLFFFCSYTTTEIPPNDRRPNYTQGGAADLTGWRDFFLFSPYKKTDSIEIRFAVNRRSSKYEIVFFAYFSVCSTGVSAYLNARSHDLFLLMLFFFSASEYCFGQSRKCITSFKVAMKPFEF